MKKIDLKQQPMKRVDLKQQPVTIDKLLTLSEVKQQIQISLSKGQQEQQILYSSIGVIVDCSGPHKIGTNKDYLQQIKIIDPTSTQTQVLICLFQKNKQQCINTVNIADIVMFYQFKGELYNNCPQVKRNYQNKSIIKYFRGFSESQDYDLLNKKQQLQFLDSQKEVLHAIINLRKFSRIYFSQHMLQGMYLSDGDQQQSKIFDLILEVTGYEVQNSLFKIQMTDGQELFHMNFHSPILNGVYKVRSIIEVQWMNNKCILFGNDYTAFLAILPWMRSYNPNTWDKLKRKVVQIIPPRYPLTTILHENPFTTVHHENRKKEKRLKSSLKELCTKQFHDNEVLIECEIIAIEPDDILKALTKYDKKKMKETSLDSKDGRYTYTMKLFVSDQSLAEDQIYVVYLYTYDGRGCQFLPKDLNFKYYNPQKITNFNASLKNWQVRLLSETHRKQQIKLVLSPLFNGKITIYRVVDTEILM